MLLHHKIVFLKIQLSFKASLSRTDSLIHEYEESIDPKTERTGFNDNHHEADMNGYVDYIPKMLMQFRLGIHSMLDETIRSSSKLIREKSNL